MKFSRQKRQAPHKSLICPTGQQPPSMRPNVAPTKPIAKRVAKNKARLLLSAMRYLISAFSRRFFPPTETFEGYDAPELIEVIFQKTEGLQAT